MSGFKQNSIILNSVETVIIPTISGSASLNLINNDLVLKTQDTQSYLLNSSFSQTVTSNIQSDLSNISTKVDSLSASVLLSSQSISVASVSASQQLNIVDYVTYGGADNKVLILPMANINYPRGISITIKNLSVYSVTISAQTGNNIEGYSAFTLPTKNSFTFSSDSISSYGIN